MSHEYIMIEQSPALQGEVVLEGAKNAVLVIMASLILTEGKSQLTNVPLSDDVFQMMTLLQGLGAQVSYNEQEHSMEVDTTTLCSYQVSPEIMKKMRASILVMGPLLARFGKAHIALPGGCLIGARPIDFHLKAFSLMGVKIEIVDEYLNARAHQLQACRLILEYPSVGATENIIMASTLTPGKTSIINAALEPEVLDLITLLQSMGACITIIPPATIDIEGVSFLRPVTYAIMPDRLEAGTLLLAAAMSGGSLTISQAPTHVMEVFLDKLQEIGHSITIGNQGVGITFVATQNPRAVSFKTMPYPGFPTDLQAPMMATLCLASGVSVIHETVFENRMLHVRELQKMGAQIDCDGNTAKIKGVDELYGTSVIASDIRASAALIIAGLAAQGRTMMTGVHHVRRGYHNLDAKLRYLGGNVRMVDSEQALLTNYKISQCQS